MTGNSKLDMAAGEAKTTFSWMHSSISRDQAVTVHHHVAWYDCCRTALHSPERLTNQPGLSPEVREEPFKRGGGGGLQGCPKGVVACTVIEEDSASVPLYFKGTTSGVPKGD